jgi:hypothetical protein
MSLTKVSYAMINATIANVLDYGAVGDGVADDTAAIRAAIAASNCVYIPSGTYKIARTGSEGVILGLKSNFRIYGDGASSVIKFSDAVNATNFWRIIGISNTTAGVGYENITIENLALDGSTDKTDYSPSSEQNHGVFFFSSGDPIDGIVINNVQAYSFSGDAFAISTGTKNGRVSNCTATEWIRQGFNVNGIGDHTIIGNYALRMATAVAGGSGVHCEPSTSTTNLFITNNIVDSILVGGDSAAQPLYNCKIIGNTVTGVIRGNFHDGLDIIGNTCSYIEGGRSINTKVIGNQVTADDSTRGIYFVQVLGVGDNIIISENKVVGSGANPDYGIYVNQLPYGAISNNTVTGFAFGIGTQGGGYYTITNNYVEGTTYGIVLVSSVTLTSLGSTLVSANNISGTTADMRISGNYFTDLRIGANSYANGTISTSGSPVFKRLSPYTQKGTTANRPTGLSAVTDIGYFYLDTTLDADGKPIWWNGTAWIDATGAVV